MTFLFSKTRYLFIYIITFSILIMYFTNQLLFSETIYYNTFAEQLTAEKIDGLIKETHQWAWLGYVFVPIFYAIKFLLISLILLTGFFFFENKVGFAVIFRAVILAEIPFLVVPVIKLFWFLFIQTHYDLNDLQYFYPLSALQLFDVKSLPTWQVYPLQLFNIFELIYWVLLAYWLKKYINISLNRSMEIVASSYGTGFLLWCVFITFLSLNVAP